MKYITAFIAAIDKINRFISEKIMLWLTILLVLTLVFEVFMRYIIGRPTLWSFDVSYMLASLFIAFGLAYTLQMKGHVSIDVFYARFPRSIQLVLNTLFTLILFFPVWILFIYHNIPHLLSSWAIKERAAAGTWLPPAYPFKTWIFVAIVLLILQGVAEFLKDILEWLGKEGEKNES